MFHWRSQSGFVNPWRCDRTFGAFVRPITFLLTLVGRLIEKKQVGLYWRAASLTELYSIFCQFKERYSELLTIFTIWNSLKVNIFTFFNKKICCLSKFDNLKYMQYTFRFPNMIPKLCWMPTSLLKSALWTFKVVSFGLGFFTYFVCLVMIPEI